MEAESGKRLKVLRTDRDKEFTAVEFATYCAEEGVNPISRRPTHRSRTAWWNAGTRPSSG